MKYIIITLILAVGGSFYVQGENAVNRGEEPTGLAAIALEVGNFVSKPIEKAEAAKDQMNKRNKDLKNDLNSVEEEMDMVDNRKNEDDGSDDFENFDDFGKFDTFEEDQ